MLDRTCEVFPFGWVGLAEKGPNAVGDKERLVFAVGCFIVADQRAALAVGPELLALALQVVGNHGARGLQNRLRRAVVLLQADDAGVREVLFKVENVVNVCAAP